jgi:hypothetical protein
VRETSARLLSLLSLLQARRDWPGQLLAERLDVSPRTVRRDALEVTAVEPSGTRTRPEADTAVLTALGAAVRAREVLRFDYAGADAPRRVQPHHVVTWGGRWYLLAWDLDRDAWRTFRADRIAPRTPTGPRFTPREVPGGDVAAFVASHFRGGAGTEGWPCRGQVVLALPADEVAPRVGDGLVEEIGPGRCRLTLGSWSWIGLAVTVGRFDADFEVVGPPELSDAVARLAARYAGAPSRTAE